MENALISLSLFGTVSLLSVGDGTWDCAVVTRPDTTGRGDAALQVNALGSSPEVAVAALEEKLEILWPLLNQVFSKSCAAYAKKGEKLICLNFF